MKNQEENNDFDLLSQRFSSLPRHEKLNILTKLKIYYNSETNDYEKDKTEEEILLKIKNIRYKEAEAWELVHKNFKVKCPNPFTGEKGEILYYIMDVCNAFGRVVHILDEAETTEREKLFINNCCNSIDELRKNADVPGKSILLGVDLDKILEILNSLDKKCRLPLNNIKSNGFIIEFLCRFLEKDIEEDEKETIKKTIKILEKSENV